MGCTGRSIVAAVVMLALSASTVPLAPLPASAREGRPARVTMLADEEFAPALLEGIRSARRSILCTYFLFKVTDSRRNEPLRIAEELVRARRRGVAVTVVLEQDNKRRDQTIEENGRVAALLRNGGVTVRFDAPRTTTHVKATVIDGRSVYLGSHNLTQSALHHNNELSVLIDSPELADEVSRYLDRL